MSIPKVVYNTGDYEWITPKYITDLAKEVMGAIDLDPASSEIANTKVGARSYYTAEQDGLSLEWRGNIWLNPPYSTRLITLFTEKLMDCWRYGQIDQAILLVNNSTETQWFQAVAKTATAAVFPAGRIRFEKPDGQRNSPLQGQTLFYYGSMEGAMKFLVTFCDIGFGVILPS